ncbi:MAG: hypothetical protein IKN04_17815 [Clostridia bacterium]|nr:hypothetical protein [Clostridia bacterium]
MNEDQYADLRAQLAANEIEHKEIKRRLDNHAEALKKQSEILVLLERQSNAIERMGRSLDRVENTVESVDARVATLEKEPGEKWKKTTWEVLKYLVLAVLGWAAGRFINGTP